MSTVTAKERGFQRFGAGSGCWQGVNRALHYRALREPGEVVSHLGGRQATPGPQTWK
jgi:hypothetical protein